VVEPEYACADCERELTEDTLVPLSRTNGCASVREWPPTESAGSASARNRDYRWHWCPLADPDAERNYECVVPDGGVHDSASDGHVNGANAIRDNADDRLPALAATAVDQPDDFVASTHLAAGSPATPNSEADPAVRSGKGIEREPGHVAEQHASPGYGGRTCYADVRCLVFD
jgi:hypothetical protein